MFQSWIHCAVILASVAASAAYAYPITPMSIEEVANDADAVVIATLTHGVQTVSGFTGTLEVQRVLKGSLAAGSMIPISFRSAEPNPLFAVASYAIPPTEAMWFVKHSGEYTLMPLLAPAFDLPDLLEPVLAAPLLPAYEPPPQASLMDRILLDMASTVERGRQFGTSQLVFMIGQMYQTVSADTYNLLLASKSVSVRAAALSVRLRLQESSLLVKYEAMFADLARTGGTSETLVENALQESRTADAGALAVLARVALSTEPNMQRFALASARALAAIHSPQTLPTLRKLLDSANPNLRAAGVNGLSSFVMNLPVRYQKDMTTMAWMQPAGQSPYLTDEVKQYIELGPVKQARDEAVVAFWRGWWSDREASLPLPK